MVSASNFKSVDKGKFTLAANAFLPSHDIVPLEDDGKGASEILINEGDFVKEGQVVAKTSGLYIHAPISGVVEKISTGLFSSGRKSLCAKIALKGALVFTGKKQLKNPWENYDKETLIYRIKEGGVLNTFDRKNSLYSEIRSIKKTENLILFVRLFDPDPSILVEDFVSKSYLDEISVGALILAKTIGASAIVFVKDRNSKINDVSSFSESVVKVFQVEADTRKYPCGTRHNIVSAAKKIFTDEIFKSAGKNDFFIDSLTALHIYNAIVLGKPEIDTFVHVTGDCLMSAAIMNVKIGTSLRDVVEMCGGFKRKLSKIMINGMMKGIAITNLDIPVTKSMKSVEFVPVGRVKNSYSEICIRCGNCRKICPVELWPGNLYRVMHISDRKNGLLDSESIAETSLLCVECGLCNSVCPSRLPLQQTISLLKENINAKK